MSGPKKGLTREINIGLETYYSPKMKCDSNTDNSHLERKNQTKDGYEINATTETGSGSFGSFLRRGRHGAVHGIEPDPQRDQPHLRESLRLAGPEHQFL